MAAPRSPGKKKRAPKAEAPATAAGAADGDRPIAPARRFPDLSALLALGAAALVLFPYLGKSGIWDPYELDSADLARRIAIHAFGAKGLEIPGAQGGLPTLTDLEMGELPFTSMALGFKLFGLHDWSGRLPLAVWGFAGVAVLFVFLSRLVGRRAGLYGALALVTMPLYFMQARTMLGDVVTMASVAAAFAGLTGAVFDRGEREAGERSPFVPIAWLALGLAGAAAGFLSRGLLLGVAVPSLAAGSAWLVTRAGADRSGETFRRTLFSDVVGALCLAAGIVTALVAADLLARQAADAPLARVLGVAVLKKPPTEATFDLALRDLGHALFPWSAFLPFAVGLLMRAPAARERAAFERETGARVALLVGAGVAFAASAYLGPRTGPVPFAGTALLAGIAAVAIVDLERAAAPSRALALGVVLLAFVLYRDMTSMPEKAFAVFVVDKPTFPKSFEQEAGRAMKIAAAAFALLLALTWFEVQPPELARGPRALFRRRVESCRTFAREVARAWGGNLVFTLIVIEAALVGLGAMLFFGKRLGWAPVDKLPQNFISAGLNLWWAAPLVAVTFVPVGYAVRDLFSFATSRARLPRAAWASIAGVLAGAVLAFWYYPALAAQLSPKEVFESYARIGPGEPLALVGVRNRAAAYYHAGEVESFSDAARAFAWLTERMDQRRFMIVKADDLTKLNSLYRKLASKNLPVLDGRSSQILLVSNQLGEHKNESWLTSVVLDEPVRPARPVEAQFEDQLEVLGWEVTDLRGKLLDDVVPAQSYRLRFYYRVLRPITSTWKAFIHIDGYQRRFNGDHAVLDGKYPMSLWQPGDVVVDDYEFQLEPNFTPGDYTVFFGFFSGDNRFRVTRGPNHENRVNGGAIRVR